MQRITDKHTHTNMHDPLSQQRIGALVCQSYTDSLDTGVHVCFDVFQSFSGNMYLCLGNHGNNRCSRDKQDAHISTVLPGYEQAVP